MDTKNLKPIADMTDSALTMKPHHLFGWREWWKNVLKLQPAPSGKTYEHKQWIDLRSKVVNRINRELRARNRAERLKVVGQGKGLYLVDKEDVAPITIEEAIRKLIQVTDSPIKIDCEALSECLKLSENDRKALGQTVALLQAQKDAALVGISRLPSLPGKVRNEIIKKLGFSAPRKQGKRKGA